MERNISSKIYRIKLYPYTFDISINKNGFFRSINDNRGSLAARIHFHTQYELFFIKDGAFVLSTKENDISFSNAAICISPNLPHSVKHAQNTYHFRFEMMQSKDKQGELYSFNSLFTQDVSAFSVSEALFTYLEEIHAALDAHSPHRDEKISALLRLVLLELFEANIPEKDIDEKATVDDYLMIIEDFIHNRYREQITLKEVSAALHLSEKQTSRIIKKRYHSWLNSDKELIHLSTVS